MLCFKGTVQRLLDFQGTLLNLLAVTNLLAECCNLGSNFRFFLLENYFSCRGSTANLILELSALSSQRLQLRFLLGAVCQQFFHSLDILAGKIPSLSVNIIQVPEVRPQLWAGGAVGRAFGQDSKLIAIVEIQTINLCGRLSGLVFSQAGISSICGRSGRPNSDMSRS